MWASFCGRSNRFLCRGSGFREAFCVHSGLQRSVLLCSVAAEVFASPEICSDCASEISEWPLRPSLNVFISECL